MQGTQWTVPGKLRATLAAAVAVIILLVREQAWYDWQKDLLHEIGFALLVAVFIWIVFDYFSHTDEEDRWRTRIEQITSEVFYGVLRRNLPKELLAEANTLILNQVFVRKGLSVEYLLEDDTYVEASGLQQRYTKVSASIRYTVVNVSDSSQTFPIAVMLPNPIVSELKDKTDVVSVSINQGGHNHSPDIRGERERFRLEMSTSQGTHVRCDAAPLELAANESVEVEMRYVMAKEEEDSENFETLYPSDSVRLMIVDRGSPPRRVGASSHHPGELECQTLPGGPYQYRLNRYLLPHQGFSFWWKKG